MDINYEIPAFNKFKSQLKSVIISSPFFENKFVCDFDIKTASLRENKKNYFMFEFYVKQKDHVVQLSLKLEKYWYCASGNPLLSSGCRGRNNLSGRWRGNRSYFK